MIHPIEDNRPLAAVFTDNQALRDAVDLWLDDKLQAMLDYGHISDWNVLAVGALDLAGSCWLLLPFSLAGNTLQEVVSSFRRQLLGEKISQFVVCVHLADRGCSRYNGLSSYAILTNHIELLGQRRRRDR